MENQSSIYQLPPPLAAINKDTNRLVIAMLSE